MALHAVLPEFVLMRIFMAVRAAGERYTSEFLELLPVNSFCLMAFQTIYCFVFTIQLKSRIRVIELCSWLESFLIMAIETVC